ncbi:hypothetical protein JTE90_005013 [Oedothorax gibbosus]|uniref:Uncharacterized protein n=1 Tax=Oedothorax gibbosus TaxID=931172 RepID=A0AAV6VCL1_9ARAC|nr:hypothetical protein JTE90_005013 [Oedothorax gibbosus]
MYDRIRVPPAPEFQVAASDKRTKKKCRVEELARPAGFYIVPRHFRSPEENVLLITLDGASSNSWRF